ncbi:hypothetical protein [Planococcus sp. PAMC 21323]|uniref:hypothetical protein n=1 Tax=Planococcus sp. PAMC 21323 TaxID=1526927 RepID=UPI00068CB2A2|nr:hypothetical protein [Planococcus sp. PAMC 21323]
MDTRTGYILGSLFMLTSGLIFTIERLTAYVYWTGQVNTGQWDTVPQTFSFFDNLFIPLFFIVGLGLIAVSFERNRM